jgi:hypothetical protein
MAGPYNIDEEIVSGDLGHIQWSEEVAVAVNDIHNRVAAIEGGPYTQSVLVATGSEARPDAELVIWIDPDDLGATNATANDLIINPSESTEIEALINAKGDLLVGTAADTLNRLGVGANGTVLTADSAEASGLKWAAPSGGGGVDTFPMKPGQFYTTTHPLNAANTDAGEFGTGGDRMFLLPFALTHDMSVDRFGLTVTTAGGSGALVRAGIYEHDDAWGTVDLLVETSFLVDTTGEKFADITAFPLTAGFYWLAIACTDTAGTFVCRRASSTAQSSFGGGLSGVAIEWAPQYNGVSLGSGLPATRNLSGPSSVKTNDVPLIFVRRAV